MWDFPWNPTIKTKLPSVLKTTALTIEHHLTIFYCHKGKQKVFSEEYDLTKRNQTVYR